MEAEEEGCFHEAKFIDPQGLVRTAKIPVVQELALSGLKDLSSRFIKNLPDRPVIPPHAHDPLETLPSINVAKLRIGIDQAGRAEELARLACAAREWGMFLITNHGIAPAVVHGVEEVVKGFFGLTFREKKTSVGTYADVDNMGYGRNFVKSEDQPLDWMDRVSVKAAPKEATEGLDVWPQNPANFREVMERYVEEARKVCDDLLEALEEALSLKRNAFLKYLDPLKSEVNLRVNYYPPCPRPDLAMGLSGHSDASTFTFLAQFNSTHGLQVLKDNVWRTVAWPAGLLMVSVGDFLEIMSNGMVKSPWHRVVTRTDVDRISVSLFSTRPPALRLSQLRKTTRTVWVGVVTRRLLWGIT
ncbi:Codeine 3-O-demethylase [Bertholletia excelsa]